MNMLAVEPSTKNLSLAVSRKGEIVRYRNQLMDRVLSSSIIPAIRDILKSADLTVQDLDGFAVGLGPGSFTSLRVGLATVKGLAFALNKPVVGVPSLDVLALNAQNSGEVEEGTSVCAVTDARRNMVYACCYRMVDGQLEREGDYHLNAISEVLKGMSGEVVFVGDGISLYRPEITKAFGIRARLSEEKSWVPQARQLARLARERFEGGEADDGMSLVPMYLYPEDCQVKRG